VCWGGGEYAEQWVSSESGFRRTLGLAVEEQCVGEMGRTPEKTLAGTYGFG
jgi:hypothetical protein